MENEEKPTGTVFQSKYRNYYKHVTRTKSKKCFVWKTKVCSTYKNIIYNEGIKYSPTRK
jgi:hypothetical protein